MSNIHKYPEDIDLIMECICLFEKVNYRLFNIMFPNKLEK